MKRPIFDKQKDKEKDCISLCMKENDTRCAGIIDDVIQGSLARCLCPCHDNDNVPLRYEQKNWLRQRMHSPVGIPFKLWRENES